MKHLALSLSTAVALVAASGTQAATVQGLSDLTFETQWIVLSDTNIDDIEMKSFTLGDTRGAEAMIDDPAAVSAISEENVQIGNNTVEPRIPFVSSARERVNRADPTEFADAQRRTEVDRELPFTDAGMAFYSGWQSNDLTGLAQLRISEPAVETSASSFYDSMTRHTFENLTGEVANMVLVVQLEHQLTARFNGDDGMARTEVVHSFDFEGTVDGVAVIDQGGSGGAPIETGSGASGSSELSGTPGNDGSSYTALATAEGTGGFTEARVDQSRNYTVLFEIPAFGTATLFERFAQFNSVSYLTPDPMTPVPLPAGVLLLGSGLGFFAFGAHLSRRRRG